MEERSRCLTPEALLAHAGWLRQLAGSLVADAGVADDVVQETWLAALLHPPAVDRPLEPWLARVARNFAFRRRRGEERRAAHELAAGPEGEAPTPAQTVERLELQRTIVETVLALEEPFRTTIVQRYFEGRSAVEIARLFGVPAGTVRWRMKRGLAELRERLDGRFGSRGAWCTVLAPLVRRDAGAGPRTLPPSVATSSVLSTVLTMSAMQVTAVLAGVAVMAGVVWWSFTGREPSTASAPIAARALTAAPVALTATPGASEFEPLPHDARQAAAPGAASAPAPPAAVPVPAPTTALVEARFVDAEGAPWSGVRLAAQQEDQPDVDWGAPVLSHADGRARLELVFPERRGRPPITSQTLAFVARREGCTTVARRALVRADETTHLGDVVLSAGVRLSGRVLDEAGRGLAHATIGATDAELPPEDDGRLRRHGCDAFDLPVTRSADDGTFVLDGVGAGAWRLWGHADGTRYAWTAPIAVSAERDLDGLELVLPALRATDLIAGRVVDPDGKPFRADLFCNVRDARYGGFGRGEEVDEQGRFSIVVEHDGETWTLAVSDLYGRYAPTTVEGVQPGTLDLEIRMREPHFLAVHVRDPEGRPVEGAVFTLSAGGAWDEVIPTAAAPGDYRLPLPDAKFRMQVNAPGYRTERFRPLDPAALPSPLEVVLRHAPAVRGRVLAAGAPIARAEVELRRDQPDGLETVNGFRCVMNSMADVEGVTDADGRFELSCDLDGAFWIRATAPGLAPAELGPLDQARLATAGDFELVLTEGGALEGRVLPPEGGVAEGTIVAINHGDGTPRTTRAGPGGVFRFEGLAPGKWQMLASEVEVDPANTTYASIRESDPIEWSCEVAVGRTTRCDLDLRSK